MECFLFRFCRRHGVVGVQRTHAHTHTHTQQQVVKNSAASKAGLRPGDVVFRFHNWTKEDRPTLRRAAELVRSSVGKQIRVVFARKLSTNSLLMLASQSQIIPDRSHYQVYQVDVQPTHWLKGGVLGCVLNVWPPPQAVLIDARYLKAEAEEEEKELAAKGDCF